MIFLQNILFTEDDKFSDLKNIADKIIPNDPWAFVVQLLATLILVIIIAVFLVKPVRKYIAARQEYIQNNLDEAANKNSEADTKLQNADNQLKEARKTSKEMIETAKVTALNEKDRILDETKEEVLQMKEKARKDIDNERKKLQEQISSEIIDVALLAANKVIEREVNDDDNKKIIESFIKENE